MRIAITSDWHGYIPPEIPDCDLVLFAGDMGIGEKFGYDPEVLVVDWNNWMVDQPPMVAIAGNHDFENKVKIMRFLPWTYLEDEVAEIEGLKIWGSPWSNPFGYGWAFNMTEEDQEELYKQIPDDVDIIISHGPPYGYRDAVSPFFDLEKNEWSENRVGSMALRSKMEELKTLKLVACGHIHPQYGQEGIVINGSLCNNKYKPVNKPIVVEF